MSAQLNSCPKLAFLLASLLYLSCRTAEAQTFQFLPEVDLYSNIQHNVRFEFQLKETREAGDPTQAEIGPSFDFYLAPVLRLKRIAIFDLDDSKSRLLRFSIGYRYLPSADKPDTQRLTMSVTSQLPFVAQIRLSDRNRADLDWSSNQFTWRYRNRVNLNRRVRIASYHPEPYASAEFFYDSQYRKWNTTAVYAGCLFPIGKHLELDSYYEHQNITSKNPNQQLNQFGLILNVYFSKREGI